MKNQTCKLIQAGIKSNIIMFDKYKIYIMNILLMRVINFYSSRSAFWLTV